MIDVTIPTLMSQILFLSLLCVVGLVIARALKLELTLSSLLAGILGGFSLPVIGFDTGIRATNIHDLVFYVILPVLIFTAAWHINPSLLKRWLVPVSLLATAGVLLGGAVVAVISYYGIGRPQGFPWLAALLTGAILAATDPVSVVNTLDKLKAPDDLVALIEGESLFNDATSVVLFTVVLGFATASNYEGNSNYLLLFFQHFLAV